MAENTEFDNKNIQEWHMAEVVAQGVEGQFKGKFQEWQRLGMISYKGNIQEWQRVGMIS